MGKRLKNVVDGRIPVREVYTCGEIAFLLNVAHVTARDYIDKGVIPGYKLPTPGGKHRERRVLHRTLMRFLEQNPELAYVRDRLSGDLTQHDLIPETQINERSTRGNTRVANEPRRGSGRPERPDEPPPRPDADRPGSPPCGRGPGRGRPPGPSRRDR